MKNKLVYIAMFVAGAACGAGVTWQYFKKKYEQIAKEEIASVKATLLNKKKDTPDVSEPDENLAELKSDVKHLYSTEEKENYQNIAMTYTNYNDPGNDVKLDAARSVDHPYVIRPEEFDEIGYETVTLYYYADDFLADERDELVDDIENTVGLDFATHFGEFEDDSVFIRNDAKEVDYEILMSQQNYADIVN